MKKIILFLIFFSSLTAYGKYYDATIHFKDGKSKVGLVESPFGGGYIYFKPTKDAEVEEVDETLIKAIEFIIDGERREFHLLKVYVGWGQKRVSKSPMWLKVVEKGIATLYLNSMRLPAGSSTTNTAGFDDYYCFRDGEEGAKLICQVSTLNNNATFRAKAPLYFADYPELAAKIESKEYKWKDLTTVVQEYNKWAEAKK